jgi:hypothetical protein
MNEGQLKRALRTLNGFHAEGPGNRGSIRLEVSMYIGIGTIVVILIIVLIVVFLRRR